MDLLLGTMAKMLLAREDKYDVTRVLLWSTTGSTIECTLMETRKGLTVHPKRDEIWNENIVIGG